jgi:hypothetical protein
VVVNRHPDQAFSIEMDAQESTGLVSSRGSLLTHDAVPP